MPKINLLLVLSIVAASVVLPAEALAQAASQVVGPAPIPAGEQNPGFVGALLQLLPMMLICYMIFYFMVVKPQDKKSKAQKEMMESLKRGDNLVTSGGIVGKFSGLENELVLLEVSPNVRIKVVASNIAGRLDSKAEAKAA